MSNNLAPVKNVYNTYLTALQVWGITYPLNMKSRLTFEANSESIP